MGFDKRKVLSERGEINSVTVFLLLILVSIVLAVWVLGPPLYKNYMLGHFAYGQAIKAREIPDWEMTENIRKEAEKLGIDLEKLGLELQRFESEMHIRYEFEYPIKLPGFSDKTMTFSKDIQKPFSDVMRIEDDSKIKKY